MAERSPERAAHFPAIEKKHGQPMSFWFGVMKEIKDLKYPEQVAYLRENHGFSQAHANAVVAYSRGSTSSKRYATFAEYLKTLDPTKRATIKEIFAVITDAFPKTEVVIAWNQPMVKLGKDYLFGASCTKEYILIAPWGGLIAEFLPRLEKYEVNKKTIRVPADWKVEKKLLKDMVKARIAQLD